MYIWPVSFKERSERLLKSRASSHYCGYQTVNPTFTFTFYFKKSSIHQPERSNIQTHRASVAQIGPRQSDKHKRKDLLVICRCSVCILDYRSCSTSRSDRARNYRINSREVISGTWPNFLDRSGQSQHASYISINWYFTMNIITVLSWWNTNSG